MTFRWTQSNNLPAMFSPTKLAAALTAKRGRLQISHDQKYHDAIDKDDDDDERPATKRALIGPDVVVVVGGEEFEEHSQILCSWSGYFEKAFQRRTEEAKNKRFNLLLQDKNPEEWQWISAVSAPFSNETVTKENVFVALTWFDLLDSQQGLELCDSVLKMEILDEILPTENEAVPVDKVLPAKVDKALDVLNNECPLPYSKAACLTFLVRVLEEAPEVLSRDMIQSMLDFLSASNNNAQATCGGSDLWDALQSFLDDATSSGPAHVGLLENSLLSQVLYSEIQRKVTMDRMIQAIVKHSAEGDGIRQDLKQDGFFAGKLPNEF